MIMKWTTLACMLFCAATLVTAMSLLVVSTYNMTGPENKYPVPAIDNWRAYLLHIIPISGCVMIISIFSCFGATRARSPCLTSVIVFLHVCALATCIVYITLLCREVEGGEVTPQALKNQTATQFMEHFKADPTARKWVPEWLATIQKQSQTCCGIFGYGDYRDFWPETPEQVPDSCCRSAKKCVTNFEQIDWPDKPTDYIKNDEGCAAIVNVRVMQRIQETQKFFIVLVVVLALALVGFAVHFIGQFSLDATPQQPPTNFCPCPTSCPTWPFWGRRPFKNVDQYGNPIVDPTNPLLMSNTDPNIDLNDQSTYSYTFVQQLRTAQQIMDSQQTIQSPGGLMSQPNIQQMGQSMNVPQAPTFTYQVLQSNPDPYFSPPPSQIPMNGNGPIKVGSSQNLLDGGVGGGSSQGSNGPQGLQLSFPDDMEKQNLKQLLRFGRRHRRQRKQDFDPNDPLQQ